MIVLDTNVLSEAWRARPSAAVMAWMRAQPVTTLYTTTITEAELLYGIALLPEGRRRRSLEALAEFVLMEELGGRILPFDSAAAREYADIAATRQRNGRPIAEADAQIAAIARSRGAAVATRNTEDFAGCRISIIDPWRE